jgi:TolB-like protein
MRKLIFLLVVFIAPICSFSQTVFDKELNSVSLDLAGKLKAINKTKVVVLYTTDINKAQTTIGKYIADGISVDIVNSQGDFQVFDRDNLDAIAGAKKLISEGYIDVTRAKEIGRLLSVDVIIVGTYTVLSNTVRLTLKSLDANTGFVIAASAKDLPLDADTRVLLFNGGGGSDGNNNHKVDNKIVEAPEEQPTTGVITVNNKIRANLQILLSTETVEPANFGKKYFELTIATNSSDNFDNIAPGIYYLCAVFSRYDYRGCVFNKRIVVQEGKTVVVNINSIGNN